MTLNPFRNRKNKRRSTAPLMILRKEMIPEGTDPLLRQKRHSDILTGIFIGFFLVGIIIFLTKADFSKEGWTEAYFIWDKGKDIFLLVILWLVKIRFRPILRLIIGLASIRLLWEIIAYFLKIDINIDPAITMLWVTATAIIVYLSIKDLNQWNQRD